MRFIVVGYYTDKYRQDAIEMAESCSAHGIPVYCEPIEDRGQWVLNCSYKPTFLKRCVERFNIPIVYCDVDARFERFPFLFNMLDCDVSFYKGQVWAHDKTPETLSGTVFINNTPKAKEFVSNWSDNCQRNNLELDQRLIDFSIPEGCRVVNLPVEYCAIFDSPMIKGREVVVRHLQHSRQRRK
jgi:hypothetical protein